MMVAAPQSTKSFIFLSGLGMAWRRRMKYLAQRSKKGQMPSYASAYVVKTEIIIMAMAGRW